MNTLKVVCGIIWKDDKVFIARRKPEKFHGGLWEFPGGKVEANETEKESLIRELEEEMGMKVTVEKVFKTVFYRYELFTLELISFICQFQEANFLLTDHDKFEWTNIHDIEHWNLAPADREIAKEINKFYGK